MKLTLQEARIRDHIARLALTKAEAVSVTVSPAAEVNNMPVSIIRNKNYVGGMYAITYKSVINMSGLPQVEQNLVPSYNKAGDIFMTVEGCAT